MTDCQLLHVLEVNNILGESILWEPNAQQLWWTDIHGAQLYAWEFGSQRLESRAMPDRLCSFGFVANDERLICAFASGLALYHPHTGVLEWIARPEEGYTGTRFNDGRVDRQGRFWAGTMVEGDGRDANGERVSGSLYCLTGRQCQRVFGQVSIPNSLCWNRASTRAYFADSPSGVIEVFDFDAKNGALTNARPFVRAVPPSAPDGSIIDAEDCLWNAQFGGARIARYTANGDLDFELPLPVSQPTCLCFGGPEMDLLFVSSAREALSPEQLEKESQAGSVLVYRTRFRGLPEPRFRLE